MNVREFLDSVREAKFEIKRCEMRLEQLSSQATSITAHMHDMPGGGGGDLHKDALMIAIVEQKEKVAMARRKWIQRIIDIENFIDELDKATYRIILKLRYCDLLPWSEVVAKVHLFGMDYDERYIYILHGRALNEARVLWEQWEDKINVDSRGSEEDEQKLEER